MYLCDGLKVLSENTAKMVGGNSLAVRYSEILNPKPKDERTGEQIVADIVKNAGLKCKRKGGGAE